MMEERHVSGCELKRLVDDRLVQLGSLLVMLLYWCPTRSMRSLWRNEIGLGRRDKSVAAIERCGCLHFCGRGGRRAS